MIRKNVLIALLSIASVSSVSAAGIAGTASDIKALRVAMDDKLKDSDSAKFKDVRIAGDGVTCGLVNSKNSYGAYSGYQPFMAMKLSSGKFFVLSVDEAAGQVCASKGI